MSQSLSPDCTPLKTTYDTCFNTWFAGYLEPAVSTFSESTEARTKYSEEKAKEFDQKCGKIWESYKSCVQVCNETFLLIIATLKLSFCVISLVQEAVKAKGLDTLLQQARDDNPLVDPPEKK